MSGTGRPVPRVPAVSEADFGCAGPGAGHTTDELALASCKRSMSLKRRATT